MGGTLGTLARAALGQMFPTASGTFPLTTLAINVVGSFLLAFVLTALAHTFIRTPALRLFLGTGFFGGFTTFSTFVLETVELVRHGDPLVAMLAVLASVGGGICAAFSGVVCASRWRGRTSNHVITHQDSP